MSRPLPAPDEPLPSDQPTGCAAFSALVNAVLDRELGPEVLDGPHSSSCGLCRARAIVARRLLDAPFPTPGSRPGFAEQIVVAAIRDRRIRRNRRVGLVLAASLAIGFSVFLLRPTSDERRDVVQLPQTAPVIPEASPPRVSDRFVEAGSAVVAITLRAKDQAVDPTRSLLPPPEKVMVSAPSSIPGIEPAAESLAGMPGAARSGIEPVTDKTKRAVNLFLRDVGLGSQTRPKL